MPCIPHHLFHSLPLNSTAAQPGVGSLAGGWHWRGTLPLARALLPWPHCSCYEVAGCKQSRHICTSGHGQGGGQGQVGPPILCKTLSSIQFWLV